MLSVDSADQKVKERWSDEVVKVSPLGLSDNLTCASAVLVATGGRLYRATVNYVRRQSHRPRKEVTRTLLHGDGDCCPVRSLFYAPTRPSMAGRAREGWRCWLFCVLALLHSSSLALRPTPLRAAPRALHRAWAPRAVATVEATEHPLEAIRAAPAHTDSLESASVAGPLNDAPWRHAFRALAADPAFVSAGFGKAAFKLDERWDFAVGSVTMEDVERDVTLMPPQFVASGVRYQGGIYNQPFQEGFSFADLEERMATATVVWLACSRHLEM